jgi:cytochrome c biogenesis protein
MSHPERTWGKALIDALASLRLTIFLLLALAVTSIIGTIIPQGEIPPEYISSITQNKFKLYKTLGFFDMYHSWWFVGLLILFSVNLIVCSLRRLPQVWQQIVEPRTVLDPSLQQTLACTATIPLADATKAKEQLATILRQSVAEPISSRVDGNLHLFAQRHAYARLSVYVTHLSILIIFIGAIIGSVFGYKGFVTIPEGEQISQVHLRNGKTVSLDFAVRCEQFSVDHYPTGAPKEFKSILTVLDKSGRQVNGFNQVPVIVNDPLMYAGITFYQSSYGSIADHIFTVSDLSGKAVEEITVADKGTARLPDGSTLQVIESTPEVSQFMPGKRGPAVQVAIHPANGSQEQTAILYANHPEANLEHARHSGGPLITYRQGIQKEYTGLQVTKDPGVWTVWTGCILLIVGIYGAFLMSHRRIWIRISDNDITVAGHASKNPAAFAQEFDRLVATIKTSLAKEESAP